MYLSGCSDAGAIGLLLKDDAEVFGCIPDVPTSRAVSFSRSFPVAVGWDCSIAVPGVLGVLEEPNDANAPEPRPKAEEAPVVGEATLVVATGAMRLSGGLTSDVPSDMPFPPNRLVAENVRDPSDRLFSLMLLEVVKDVLLELGVLSISKGWVPLNSQRLTWSVVAKDYP